VILDPTDRHLAASGLPVPRRSLDVIADLDASVPAEPYILREWDTAEPEDTQMAVFLRRRPFPTSEDPAGLTSGAWDKLAYAIIQEQEIERWPTQRSGAERFNVYEIEASMTAEIAMESRSAPGRRQG
jgi:hypothetical protein